MSETTPWETVTAWDTQFWVNIMREIGFDGAGRFRERIWSLVRKGGRINRVSHRTYQLALDPVHIRYE
jgi:hypothetical protein